jgi:lambda family phage portal protein
MASLIDRAVSAASPSRALRRAEERLQLKLVEARSAAADQVLGTFKANGGTAPPRVETRWRGASRMLRSLVSWMPALGSAQTDLPEHERTLMAARSYDAYRGHMIARAAITRNRSNIVGTGLVVHPTIDAGALGITDDQAETINDEISREWPVFAENPVECDWDATLDIYGLQALALISSMLAGDCFANTPADLRPGGAYDLKVQLVDGARVSNPSGMGTNTDTLIDGIKLSGMGVPLGAYIRSRHPADLYTGGAAVRWEFREFFGAETGRRRLLQIWNEKDRIGAVRGAPYLAPILEPLQQLEQYGRAELTAAVVSALFTVFIENPVPVAEDPQGNPLPWISGQTAKSGTGVDPARPDPRTADQSVAQSIAMGAGAVVDLEPGAKATTANPMRPNANFESFYTAVLKQIGASLEIPLDELLLKYDASYSAARAAMLQAWRFYNMRRWWLVQQFCQPIYELWMDEAVARGRLPSIVGYADPKRRKAFTRAMWVGPARGSMDEGAEADAAKKRIDSGLSNETIETAALMGEEWRTVVRGRKRELDYRRKNNVELAPQPGQAAVQGKPAPTPPGGPRRLVPPQQQAPPPSQQEDPPEDPADLQEGG